jgi:hypothetical protein
LYGGFFLYFDVSTSAMLSKGTLGCGAIGGKPNFCASAAYACRSASRCADENPRQK